MPLKSGYGYDTVAGNINEMERAGHPRDQAVAASMALARVHFFKRHPHGALPTWLSYPRAYRMREHYDKHGRPRRAPDRERSIVDNPSTRAKVRQAARLGEAFSGHRYNRLLKVRRKPITGPRVAIGPVSGIMYLAKRDGRVEQYLHKFSPRSRPLLASSSDGTRLELLGGAFRFTERGIVDRKVRIR